MPAEGRACETCAWYQPLTAGDGGGTCRHDAPDAHHGWPVVNAKAWCRHWDLDSPLTVGGKPIRDLDDDELQDALRFCSEAENLESYDSMVRARWEQESCAVAVRREIERRAILKAGG